MPKFSSSLLTLLCAALVLISLPAWAGDKVMVIPFSGTKTQETTRRAKGALERAGHPVVISTKAPDLSNPKQLTSTAKTTGVRAFVVGKVSTVGKTWQLMVSVYSGVDGTLLNDFPLDSTWYPGLLKEIDKNLTVNVEAAMAGMADAAAPPPAEVAEPTAAPEAKAAPEEPVAKEETAEPEAPAEEPEAAAGEGPSPLFVALQFGAVIRNWKPKDAIYKQLTGQENAGLLAPRVSLGLYPVAFFSSGALANLGIVGSFEQSISGQTQVPSYQLPTGTVAAKTAAMSEQDYHFGLHARIPAGDHQFGFSAGPGAHKMTTEITPGRFIPDVRYSYFRFGMNAEFNMGALGLGLAAGYRPVSSLSKGKGQVASADWFPKAEADGMDLGVTVSYNLSKALAVLVTGDYRRYGFNFHRVPADQALSQPSTGNPIPVAGGASDAYLGFWAGVGFHLPH